MLPSCFSERSDLALGSFPICGCGVGLALAVSSTFGWLVLGVWLSWVCSGGFVGAAGRVQPAVSAAALLESVAS